MGLLRYEKIEQLNTEAKIVSFGIRNQVWDCWDIKSKMMNWIVSNFLSLGEQDECKIAWPAA